MRGLRILINRVASPLATAYLGLDRVVGAGSTATLSTHSLIALEDGEVNSERISASFEDLKPAFAPKCADLDDFEQRVAPTLARSGCVDCHAGTSDPARQAFDLGLTGAALCSAALQRVDLGDSDYGPFFAFPLSGLFGHVRPSEQVAAEIFPTWLDWARAEAAQNSILETNK
jgi:hypothetical protein